VSTSPSPTAEAEHVANSAQWSAEWPALPTETEIYILPDGRVVIADLPAELASLAAALGAAEACEIAPHAEPDSAV
jgi:hypothetical protein